MKNVQILIESTACK